MFLVSVCLSWAEFIHNRCLQRKLIVHCGEECAICLLFLDVSTPAARGCVFVLNMLLEYRFCSLRSNARYLSIHAGGSTLAVCQLPIHKTH